ncbi:hypothetical protein CLPUN_27510 [Clostridium puniceum]|uniref:Uncharacterized protein n=1 Tax=Clostridium puniceum TaxID=29367 RepID=A0A1S8TEM5_9CLOT|nr:hypothetical protein [Clostridium puniceum]OOM76250.1 hypothetical protein CLPUN_27510 [Clostridium puniceum]
MRIKKLMRTLILVIICFLIIQVLGFMAILILSGSLNNNMVVNIVSGLIIASSFVLSMLLAELFELFTGRSFGKMYCGFYTFDKFKGSDNYNKTLD